MIEISFGKMLLIGLVALIVLGPEKLPGAARTVGALLRRMRQGWDNVRGEVERELQIEEIRQAAREAAARADELQAGVHGEVRQVKARVEEALGPRAGEVETLPAVGFKEKGIQAKDEASHERA